MFYPKQRGSCSVRVEYLESGERACLREAHAVTSTTSSDEATAREAAITRKLIAEVRESVNPGCARSELCSVVRVRIGWLYSPVGIVPSQALTAARSCRHVHMRDS